MKMLLPSGVSSYPVLATRLNVWVLPETDPGVHTMPILAKPCGSASACPGISTADPAASASTSTSRPVLRAIVAFLPRRTVSACSDIGLAHVLLGGKRAALIDADLGHHSAWPSAGTGRAEAREPPPVPVLEVVDVVRAHAVRAAWAQGVVAGRVEEHVAGFARPEVKGVRPVGEVVGPVAQQRRVLADHVHGDARQLHGVLLVTEVG